GMCYMGETVVQALRDIKLPHAHSSAADVVTVSVGGTSMIPEKDLQSDLLIQLADQGVYQAKEQGRNRFISIESNEKS
ncbi:MAG: diguanylate cyclase, partial [Mariprofundaceae bacterium]